MSEIKSGKKPSLAPDNNAKYSAEVVVDLDLIDEPMIAEWIKKGELVKTESENITDAKTLASQIGLIKAIKEYGLKRIISFHPL